SRTNPTQRARRSCDERTQGAISKWCNYDMGHVICGRNIRFWALCYFIAAVLCGGCKKSQQPAKIAPGSPAPAPLQQAGSPQPKIEACSLVTKDDGAAIQRA